ncbi:hypothetical protein [Bacillus thuringiensis]|uniref:hypothetical protein n=1 Tax=Bacillus thuringiensis TaxID=1428 RepID=UPI003B97DA54
MSRPPGRLEEEKKRAEERDRVATNLVHLQDRPLPMRETLPDGRQEWNRLSANEILQINKDLANNIFFGGVRNTHENIFVDALNKQDNAYSRYMNPRNTLKQATKLYTLLPKQLFSTHELLPGVQNRISPASLYLCTTHPQLLREAQTKVPDMEIVEIEFPPGTNIEAVSTNPNNQNLQLRENVPYYALNGRTALGKRAEPLQDGTRVIPRLNLQNYTQTINTYQDTLSQKFSDDFQRNVTVADLHMADHQLIVGIEEMHRAMSYLQPMTSSTPYIDPATRKSKMTPIYFTMAPTLGDSVHPDIEDFIRRNPRNRTASGLTITDKNPRTNTATTVGLYVAAGRVRPKWLTPQERQDAWDDFQNTGRGHLVGTMLEIAAHEGGHVLFHNKTLAEQRKFRDNIYGNFFVPTAFERYGNTWQEEPVPRSRLKEYSETGRVRSGTVIGMEARHLLTPPGAYANQDVHECHSELHGWRTLFMKQLDEHADLFRMYMALPKGRSGETSRVPVLVPKESLPYAGARSPYSNFRPATSAEFDRHAPDLLPAFYLRADERRYNLKPATYN